MVALPSSSAIRTGEVYKSLPQEQHSGSAVQVAFPLLRSAVQAPPHIKVEVGIPLGMTPSADKGNLPMSALEVERPVSSGKDALEQEQSVAECSLLHLWFQDQRPKVTGPRTDQDHPWLLLAARLDLAWTAVGLQEVDCVEDRYLWTLEEYRCRLQQDQHEVVVPVDLLNIELNSIGTIEAAICAGNRHSELELAVRLTDRHLELESEANQQFPCSRCGTPVSAQPTLTAYQQELIGQDKHKEQLGRPYGALIQDLRNKIDTSHSAQDAVSRAALRLYQASNASLEAQCASSARKHGCLICFRASLDAVPMLRQLYERRRSELETDIAVEAPDCSTAHQASDCTILPYLVYQQDNRSGPFVKDIHFCKDATCSPTGTFTAAINKRESARHQPVQSPANGPSPLVEDPDCLRFVSPPASFSAPALGAGSTPLNGEEKDNSQPVPPLPTPPPGLARPALKGGMMPSLPLEPGDSPFIVYQERTQPSSASDPATAPCAASVAQDQSWADQSNSQRGPSDIGPTRTLASNEAFFSLQGRRGVSVLFGTVEAKVPPDIHRVYFGSASPWSPDLAFEQVSTMTHFSHARIDGDHHVDYGGSEVKLAAQEQQDSQRLPRSPPRPLRCYTIVFRAPETPSRSPALSVPPVFRSPPCLSSFALTTSFISCGTDSNGVNICGGRMCDCIEANVGAKAGTELSATTRSCWSGLPYSIHAQLVKVAQASSQPHDFGLFTLSVGIFHTAATATGYPNHIPGPAKGLIDDEGTSFLTVTGSLPNHGRGGSDKQLRMLESPKIGLRPHADERELGYAEEVVVVKEGSLESEAGLGVTKEEAIEEGGIRTAEDGRQCEDIGMKKEKVGLASKVGMQCGGGECGGIGDAAEQNVPTQDVVRERLGCSSPPASTAPHEVGTRAQAVSPQSAPPQSQVALQTVIRTVPQVPHTDTRTESNIDVRGRAPDTHLYGSTALYQSVITPSSHPRQALGRRAADEQERWTASEPVQRAGNHEKMVRGGAEQEGAQQEGAQQEEAQQEGAQQKNGESQRIQDGSAAGPGTNAATGGPKSAQAHMRRRTTSSLGPATLQSLQVLRPLRVLQDQTLQVPPPDMVTAAATAPLGGYKHVIDGTSSAADCPIRFYLVDLPTPPAVASPTIQPRANGHAYHRHHTDSMVGPLRVQDDLGTAFPDLVISAGLVTPVNRSSDTPVLDKDVVTSIRKICTPDLSDWVSAPAPGVWEQQLMHWGKARVELVMMFGYKRGSGASGMCSGGISVMGFWGGLNGSHLMIKPVHQSIDASYQSPTTATLTSSSRHQSPPSSSSARKQQQPKALPSFSIGCALSARIVALQQAAAIICNCIKSAQDEARESTPTVALVRKGEAQIQHTIPCTKPSDSELDGGTSGATRRSVSCFERSSSRPASDSSPRFPCFPSIPGRGRLKLQVFEHTSLCASR
ncbi:hypothetical protein CF319_g2812 [Tilletia indica]|nr:hypothetical protein CF319_g2812 [Tilletia indica]